MGSDPELESVAGAAAVYALRTWNPAKGVDAQRWTVWVTRQHVWMHWRSRGRRPVLHFNDLPHIGSHDNPREPNAALAATADPTWRMTTEDEPADPDGEGPTADCDFRRLFELHVEGRAMWSLAREAGVSEYAMRKRLDAARDRFLKRMGAI